MLRNYFTIAVRNLIKNPLNSFIKISGLAIGVAGCLIIFFQYRFETSFDTFHKNGDNIFRVYSQFSGVFEGVNRGVPNALPQALKETNYAGVESVAHFYTFSAPVQVEVNGEIKKIDSEGDMAIASSDYFSVFTFYQWAAGSPNVLNDPFSVVLTERKAFQYFGTSDPRAVIGRSIIYRDSLELTVAGLLKDVSHRTDIYFNDFVSFSTIEKSWLKDDYSLGDWGSTNSSTQCFLRLADATSPSSLNDLMDLLGKQYVEHNKEADWKAAYQLQPLSDLHFNASLGIFDNSGREPANLRTLKMMMVVAGLFLFMAVINFVNLETAQSIRRAKEVGLRKVMGGTRSGLVRHFLLESALLSSAAMVIALPLTALSVKFFAEFLPNDMEVDFLNIGTILFLIAMVGLVSVLAGLYPAFMLSSYQPAVALKNQLVSGGQTRSAMVRKVLTVFQFSFSQVLIVGTLVVGWQIHYLLNKELGFTKDAIVTFYTPWWEKDNKTSTLQHELEQIPDVLAISRNSSAPATRGYSTNSFKYQEGDTETSINVHQRTGDTTYLRLFDLKLLAGRNVQPVDDGNEFLVNRAFCERVGAQNPADVIGKTLTSGNGKTFQIVGVLENFHFQSLHHAIEPLYYKYSSDASSFSLKLATSGKGAGDLAATLAKVETAWKKIYPDQPFEKKFLDDTVRSFYESEQRTAKLTNTAMAITVFISCMGLLGLASFTATQRTKEIGVRKVLGASVSGIVALLSKEFLTLVVIALALSVPLAWYVADFWLSDFAYKVPLTWPVFLLAGLLSLVVALATVGYQALKAALTNPVDSLRYE